MPDFKETTLPSGLRIVAETDSRSYSSAYGYFVAAGSRMETDSESGLSHFLEHMMFKGTAKRSAADVNRELDELGGQSNAYTTEEQTVYYATVLPKFQDRLIELLTDMLSPTLDEDEFETERQVILEEIAKYEDQPPFGAFERAMEVYFTPRGLGRRVLGTAHSIRQMQVQSMRDYFCRRYRPENIVLAASGNVDFDRLADSVANLTQSWSSRPCPAAPSHDDGSTLPADIALDTELQISDAAQAYLVRMSKGTGTNDSNRFLLRALASVLGDEGSSRLFWDLIDTGHAEVATVWPQEFSDCGAFFTYLVCAPDELDTNRQLMDQAIDLLRDQGVHQEELSQTINKAIAGGIMQSERPSNRLFSLGSRWLTHGDYLSLDDVLDRFRAIQLDDVNQIAIDHLGNPQTEIVASARAGRASSLQS